MLDALDRRIIQLTRAGLSLRSEPYAEIAGRLRIEAAEVMLSMTASASSAALSRCQIIKNSAIAFNGMNLWEVLDIHLVYSILINRSDNY